MVSLLIYELQYKTLRIARRNEVVKNRCLLPLVFTNIHSIDVVHRARMTITSSPPCQSCHARQDASRAAPRTANGLHHSAVSKRTPNTLLHCEHTEIITVQTQLKSIPVTMYFSPCSQPTYTPTHTPTHTMSNVSGIDCPRRDGSTQTKRVINYSNRLHCNPLHHMHYEAVWSTAPLQKSIALGGETRPAGRKCWPEGRLPAQTAQRQAEGINDRKFYQFRPRIYRLLR